MISTIIIFFLVLFVVVVVHESGHFFAAKLTKMRVKEFAFGFPPRIFSFKKGETTYAINSIPLGGYVSIDGENASEELKDDPAIFTNKSKIAQIFVLIAGPFMNILLAFVLFSLAFMIGHDSTKLDNNLVILNVLPGYPAEVSGILPGDEIKKISIGENIYEKPNIEQFQEIISESAGEILNLEIVRKNEISNIEIVPKLEDSSYKIGVSLGVMSIDKLSFFKAIKEGFITTITLTKGTIVGLWDLISNIFSGSSVKASVSGPVGIAKEIASASKLGFVYLLSFVAYISINLGILNMLPFPALDGGRILFVLIEWVKGSRINPKISEKLNLIGFGLLIILMIFVTIKDIIKLF